MFVLATKHTRGDMTAPTARWWWSLNFVHKELHDLYMRKVYDRAALIALPPGTRERYADLLCRHLPDGCRGLLVTLAYDQNEMDGPPFSVPDSEVRALLTPAFGAEPLAAHDALADNERFRQKGLSALRETVWRLSSGA